MKNPLFCKIRLNLRPISFMVSPHSCGRTDVRLSTSSFTTTLYSTEGGHQQHCSRHRQRGPPETNVPLTRRGMRSVKQGWPHRSTSSRLHYGSQCHRRVVVTRRGPGWSFLTIGDNWRPAALACDVTTRPMTSQTG